MTYTETVTSVANLVSARTDTGCGTATSTTVTDAAAAAGDLGKAITGPGIPAGTSITAVSAGTGYTISQAATATASSLTFVVFQQLRAVAGRTGFVRVYDPTLGLVNSPAYSSAWNTAAHSANLPQVGVVTAHTQFDDAAPWYANPTDSNTYPGSGTATANAPQTGLVDVTLVVPVADVVNAASVQTFHCDQNTLVVVATG